MVVVVAVVVVRVCVCEQEWVRVGEVWVIEGV